MRVHALLAGLVLLAACVPIPPYHATCRPISPNECLPTRANVPEDVPTWLEPGRTTLADVFLHLGEPDEARPDGRTLGWQTVDMLGGGLLLIPTGYQVGVLEADARRHRRLVVQFDSNGVVIDATLQSATCMFSFFLVAGFGGDCLPPL